MGEIITTDEFSDWFCGLGDDQAKAIVHVVEILRLKGTTLGHPYSSAIKGSRYPFRELRSQRYASALRVIYAYSPEQNAVLLIAGDKAGNPRFYQEIIPKAERIWKQYLKERTEELRRSRIAEPPRRR
jgi:hypothetical protein